MTRIQLTSNEIDGLLAYVARTDPAWRLRRALAILWLGEGASAQNVADRLRVSRATVYNWATRYRERADREIGERVADAARSGRPKSTDDRRQE